MTRFLSESLQVTEPYFRTGLRRLELANGNPAHDIRLSAEVLQLTQSKICELGLDPRDTTARELYHALQQRVKDDDIRLTKIMRTQAAMHVSAEGDVVDGMAHVIKQLPVSKNCFALKSSSLHRLLKKLPPKKAMKQLGYRSLDSFLKHESAVSAFAAAWLSEGEGWRQRILDQYKKLQPIDFESRRMQIVQLDAPRWSALATQVISQNKHNLLCFRELGALVFLPFGQDVREGAVTLSLTLALHELNEIKSCSTFLKLYQVKPDFGLIVQQIASDEPKHNTQLLDQAVPWHTMQRYYSGLARSISGELFGPHIHAEDMMWHPLENALKSIDPALAFWHRTAHLSLLHDNQSVSLNVVDAALNYCHKLPFERRLSQYFKRSLWQELLLRYMQSGPFEQNIFTDNSRQLVAETVLA